jgi:hypothetical protein
MKILPRLALLTILTVLATHAAPPKSKKLTPEKLAALTSAEPMPKYERCHVTMEGLSLPVDTITGAGVPKSKPQPAAKVPSSVGLRTNGQPAVLELIRELRFPSAFEPPKPMAKGQIYVTPTTPTEFETANTGWTITFAARQEGRLLAIRGSAEYVEAELLPGGYGQAAQPIYTADGELITPNKISQPKIQSTKSHFVFFAEPGESCEVTLFRGNQPEKHKVTVTVD